jgi:hypothetical protein
VLPPDEDADDVDADDADPHAITAKPGKTSVLQKVLPIDDRLEDVQREGKTLARENRIDLDEALEKEFENKEHADEVLARVKEDLPVVQSAYVPSGKLPSSALGLMVFGTWVAALAALATEVIVGMIAALVIGLLLALNAAIAALGCIVWIVAIFAIIIGFIAYLAPFFCGGLAAAWVTSYFGRLGKNRNMTAVALVSVFATALATIALWLVFVLFARGALDRQFQADMADWNLHWIGHVAMAIGALIAVITAWFTGRNLVQSAKFCEKCEEFMEETELNKLSVGALRTMVEALSVKNTPVAASLQCSGAGPDGKMTLFACPLCQAGIVEVELSFDGKYKDNEGNEQNMTESWLVVSKKLKATDVAWFKLYHERAGGEPVEEKEE